RQPREGEEDDEDQEERAPTASPGFELLNSLVAQIVPLVVSGLAGKKPPKLDEMLDWRKAAPQAASPTADVTPASPSKGAKVEAPPLLDPKLMEHFLAIQNALTPAEAALARQVAAELSPQELRAWMLELSALSVPDAVAKVLSIVGAANNVGGVQ